jgi:hypothetical protein
MRMLFRSFAMFTLSVLLAASCGAHAAESGQYSVAELAGLIGKTVPKDFSELSNVNAGGKYAKGIDVLSGTIDIKAGDVTVQADLLLFVRKSKIGCVRAMQTWESLNAISDDQAAFNAVQAELRKATEKPDSEGSSGESGGSWWDKDGTYVMAARGYDQQGMVFYIYAKDMEAAFKEYWAGVNAEAEAAGSFYMP